MDDTERLLELQRIAGKFIEEVLGREVPWTACAGPATWAGVYQREALPVYVWELDTTQVSAGRLLAHRHLLHDISTALGGMPVRWKNHVGLGLVFDERPAPYFPARIPLPEPLGNDYLIPFGTDIHGQAVWRSLRDTKNIVIAGGHLSIV